MAGAHKDFAASAMDKLFGCPGSIAHCAGLPERTSAYAEQGTRAHEVLEAELRVLLGGNDGADIAVAQALWAAVPDHEREEMRDGVAVAVDYVNARLTEHPDAVVSVEIKLEVSSSAAPGQVGGTADIIIYYPSLQMLEVVDFKYGAGVAVEAIGNRQMRTYGVGAYEAFTLPVRAVRTTIIQPRAFHPQGSIRFEDLEISELLDFHADLEEAIERALAPDAPLVPGQKQCRWCIGQSTCPALEQRALTVAGSTFANVKMISKEALPEPKALTPDRIGYILTAKALLTDWFDAVTAEAYALAMSGTQIPGFKLVTPVGRRTFAGTVAETSAKLEEITGLPAAEFVRDSLLTLDDTEKLIKSTLKPKGKEAVAKGLEQFAFLTTKKSSDKLQLVADDDRRPAVTPASQAFANVVQIPHIERVSE